MYYYIVVECECKDWMWVMILIYQIVGETIDCIGKYDIVGL